MSFYHVSLSCLCHELHGLADELAEKKVLGISPDAMANAMAHDETGKSGPPPTVTTSLFNARYPGALIAQQAINVCYLGTTSEMPPSTPAIPRGKRILHILSGILNRGLGS